MTRRISLAMTLLTGLLVIVMAVPLVILFRSYQYDRLTLGLERDALVIAADLASTPQDQWAQLINAYEARTGVRVTVVDAGSHVLLDSEGAAVGTVFNRGEMRSALGGSISAGVRYSTTLGTDLRYVAVPIRDGPTIQGAVRLSVSEAEIQHDVQVLVLALISVLVVVLLAAALAAWGLGRALSKPLARLAAGAERVGEDPAARVGDINGPAEIQNVADALDETAGKLDAMLSRSRAVAADASHHLRTPLAAMRLRLESIADTAPDPELVKQAEAAMREVDRLTRRVDQVLALATAESAVAGVVLDVGEVAYLRSVEWQHLAADRELELSCSHEVALVKTSVTDVERILDELVGNALDYAARRVAIEVSVTGETVRLLVSDDGPGIPIAERERVFDRFQRGGEAIPGGTGLGLALVRQAAAGSGGTARVLAADPGTTFEVTWPRASSGPKLS